MNEYLTLNDIPISINAFAHGWKSSTEQIFILDDATNRFDYCFSNICTHRFQLQFHQGTEIKESEMKFWQTVSYLDLW